MITVDDVLKLEDWVERAKTPEEKKAREEAARQEIFPDGLSEDEVAERKQVLERSKAARRQQLIDNKLDPMPTLSIPRVPTSIPSDWEGFVSKKSKAYRRGSIHDGTGAEVERMRREAKGSPFDVGIEARVKPLKR